MKKRTKEFFKKHLDDHPPYVLCLPDEDLGKDNHLKVEIDVDNLKTISAFLEGENQNNRIKHLFKFLVKNYDELTIDDIIDFIAGKYGKKKKSLESVLSKVKK